MAQTSNLTSPAVLLKGLVTKAHSGFFTVKTADGTYMCQAAGRLTKSKHTEDALAVGDQVIFEKIVSEGYANGRITAVEPRLRSLSRKDPIASIKARDIQQVIVANVDLVVFIFSCAEPDFHPRMLDRYLVGAEAQQLPVLIVASKVDLVGLERAHAIFADYVRLGYEVIYTAARPHNQPYTGDDIARYEQLGLPMLRERLHGKLSVFTGKSGVGKSSLLNALKPGLAQEVGAVSESLKKGKHTTVVPELVALDEHSWIADTPGIRSYAIWDVEAEELDAYYRDIKPFVSQCAFSDCTHLRERDCAVRAAVERGEISAGRYDSYCRLREELGQQKRW